MERAKRNHPYGASEGCHTKLILSSFLASFFTVPFFSVTFFTLLFSATLFTLPFFSRLFLRCLSLGDCVFTPFIASFLATSFRDFYFATFFTVPFFRRLCFHAFYCEFFGDLFPWLLFRDFFSATLLLRLLPWAQSTARAGKWRRQIIVKVVSHRKNNERG